MKVKAIGLAATLASTVAFATVVTSQGTSSPPQPPTTQSGSAAAGAQQDLRGMDGQTVTVSGCLKTEESVPGQKPNIAERAGVAPDYILTDVQARSASPSGGGGGAAAAGAPGAASSAMNVKLTKVDNDKMRENLNKQVEVTGRLNAKGATGTAGAAASAATGGSSKALPELEVQSIRVTGQTCTAK
jgi:hypothetical protein